MESENSGLFDSPLKIINIGLQNFAESMLEQDVEVVHIYWEPPAGGDEEMINLLDKLL
jgi:FdrA protein